MIRRLIVPLTAAVVTLHTGQVFAQGAFPSQGSAPVSSGFSGPPPQASGSADACMKGFVPLREEAERRGKMIKYVETNSAKCGIPPQIAEQLRTGHKNTDKMQKQVCAVAQQAATRGPAGPSLSEVLGSSAALPEAQAVKKGGSTFDTLNGNVLAR